MLTKLFGIVKTIVLVAAVYTKVTPGGKAPGRAKSAGLKTTFIGSTSLMVKFVASSFPMF